MGLALLAQALQKTRAENKQQYFQELKEEMSKAEEVQDVETRLKMQVRIYEEQDKIVKRMNLEIRKKYILSKRSVYGIDNEVHMIQQLKKSLKDIINKRTALARRLLGDEDYVEEYDGEGIEPELDPQTKVTLMITANLKDLTMKQHIKQMLFQKFKNQLIKKAVLEKIFGRVQKQMRENMLRVRANKFCYFKACYFIVRSTLFSLFSIVCIIANALVLAMDKYPLN